MGGLLAGDTPMQPVAVDWFGRAAALAARIPAPSHPIVPLIGPVSRLFGAVGQGLPPPARRTSTRPWPTRIRGSAR
jgi:hypothetical protein